MQRKFSTEKDSDGSLTLTPENPQFSLIWLTGMTGMASSSLPHFEHPRSPLHEGCRVRLLQSPIRAVTILGGAKVPNWYDIRYPKFEGSAAGGEEGKLFDLGHVRQSLGMVEEKVKEEVEFWKKRGVGDAWERVFVGGFSQGCAIALLYGLSSKHKIGGVIGLGGHMFNSFALPNLGTIPIILQHGLQDSTIPIQMARHSYKKIVNSPGVKYSEKKGHGHMVSLEQVGEVTEWMLGILGQGKGVDGEL